MNNNRSAPLPIGIFDSGIGGLTVVKEILKILPNESIYYLGDTARVPYGIRSPETVTRYAVENTEFLLSRKIKLIIVACNTVSSTSIDTLTERTAIPVLNVLGPGARAALRQTENKRIGVIGTDATVSSNAYQEAITLSDSSVTVFGRACPLFVPLVEEGWTEGTVVRMVASEYLNELKEYGIDTLVLGCTHYPLLKPVIAEIMDGVALVDSAVETAVTVRETLSSLELLNSGNGEKERRIFVTDSPEKFQKVGERFLGSNIDHIEKVKLSFTL